MRLYLKHLFRAIGKKPLQPLILVLTLTLAILASTVSLTVDAVLAEESELLQGAKYGSSDIEISLSADSESRFMFADDAKALLPEGTLVVGSYELPLFLGEQGETVFGVAVEFSHICEVFDIKFTSYGELCESELQSSAFVSEELAEQRGLSVGSQIEFELLGDRKVYTVKGISPNRFLGDYEIMVDVSGVMRSLASDSLILSAMRDSFRPSSRLYVDLPDSSVSVGDAIKILRSSEEFSDKSVFDVGEKMANETQIDQLELIVRLVIILVGALAASVSFCCFYILSMERREENDVFIAAGAKAWQTTVGEYAEIFAYWLISFFVSLPLAGPIMRGAYKFIGCEYARYDFEFGRFITASLAMLFVSFVSVWLFALTRRMRRKRVKKHTRVGVILVSFTLLAISFGTMYLIDVKKALIPGIISMLLALLVMFVVSPRIQIALFGGISKIIDNRYAGVKYALKNIQGLKVLHNFSALTALLVAILLSSLFVMSSANINLVLSEKMFTADYAVLGASDGCFERLKGYDGVKRAEKAYFGGAELNGNYTHAVSVASVSALSAHMGVDSLPNGRGAVITFAQAEWLGVEIGDSFEMNVGGESYELTVSEISDSGKSMVIFDCDALGISPNMLLVSKKDDVSDSEAFSSLVERTAVELAAVMRIEDLFEDRSRSVDFYLRAGDMLLIIIAAFALIGLLNNLYECYRSRREEFSLYSYAGMSKRVIFKMKLTEIASSILFGVVLGIVGFIVVSLAINRTMNSFAYDGYSNAIYLFKEL